MEDVETGTWGTVVELVTVGGDGGGVFTAGVADGFDGDDGAFVAEGAGVFGEDLGATGLISEGVPLFPNPHASRFVLHNISHSSRLVQPIGFSVITGVDVAMSFFSEFNCSANIRHSSKCVMSLQYALHSIPLQPGAVSAAIFSALSISVDDMRELSFAYFKHSSACICWPQ